MVVMVMVVVVLWKEGGSLYDDVDFIAASGWERAQEQEVEKKN